MRAGVEPSSPAQPASYPPRPPFSPYLGAPPARSGTLPLRLAGGGLVKVVGESHYQPALACAANGQVAWADPVRVGAVLIAEPGNRYDANAVRIEVGGRLVGYLPAVISGDYQPGLLELAGDGRHGWCEGRILGGGKHYYGIHLALDVPAFIRPLNEPGLLAILDSQTHVTVSGGRSIQAALLQVADATGCVSAGSVWVELIRATSSSGKHAGSPVLTVGVNEVEVGSLTPAMSRRHLPSVARAASNGANVGCLGYLRCHDSAWSMSATLPEGQ